MPSERFRILCSFAAPLHAHSSVAVLRAHSLRAPCFTPQLLQAVPEMPGRASKLSRETTEPGKTCGKSTPGGEEEHLQPEGQHEDDEPPKKLRRVTSAASTQDDLYIMSNDRLPGEYKIGRSKAVSNRQRDLQGSHNFRMIVHAVFPGSGHIETRVHSLLSDYHLTDLPGHEWFEAPLSTIMGAVSAALESCLMCE